MDITGLLNKIYNHFAHEADNGGEDTAYEIFVELLKTAIEMAQALSQDDISGEISRKAERANEVLEDLLDRMEWIS